MDTARRRARGRAESARARRPPPRRGRNDPARHPRALRAPCPPPASHASGTRPPAGRARPARAVPRAPRRT
ncbi:MAG: hypothetical protein FJ298_13145 [Planctomycetes bacterium]|nr:hypothetical protein [Planctomycetota bacterium]